MSIAQSLLPEFDQEMASTRKVLERIPSEKWNWKPHEKSGTLGWLASHVGTIPGWYTMTLQTENLDYAPVDGPQYEPPKIESPQQLLATFDKESQEARAALREYDTAQAVDLWAVVCARGHPPADAALVAAWGGRHEPTAADVCRPVTAWMAAAKDE